MKQRLNDFAPNGSGAMTPDETTLMLERIRSNFFDFMAAAPTSASKARLIELGGVVMRFTGLPLPLFNGVISTRLTTANVDEKIRQTLAFVRSHGVPMLWWVFPGDTPECLTDDLIRHGFTLAGRLPAMALRLAELKSDRPIVPGLEIRRFDDGQTLQTWCGVMVEAMGIPEAFAADFTDIYVRTTQDQGARRIHYLGLYNGTPVATAAMNYTDEGVAGVYNITTRAALRNKGIGRAMTVHALLQARDAGYAVSTLGSSELGLSVYRSIGFIEYGSISHYLSPA